MSADVDVSGAFRSIADHLLRDLAVRLGDLVERSGNEDFKLEAMQTLGKLGCPESRNLLLKGLEEFADFVEPVQALGYFRDPETLEQVLKTLEYPDVSFKDEMVRVVGEICDPRAIPRLGELLHDPDRMVRYQAAWALYKIGGRDVSQTITRLIMDPDEWIVVNVLEILSRLRDPESIPTLVGQFKITNDARLRANIISALSVFQEHSLLPVFEEGLKAVDARIQANAVEAVSQMNIPGSEKKRRLKKHLKHHNNRVKGNAVVALFDVLPDDVTEEIQGMIEGKEVPIRRSAAYALSRIKIPEKRELLEPLLRDSSFHVRKMAVKAFLVDIDRPGYKRLEAFFQDENPWVRRAAFEGAGRLADFPTTALLEALEKEDHPAVLEALLEVLTTKKLHSAASIIAGKFRQITDEEVRVLLLRALGLLNSGEILVELKRNVKLSEPEPYREYLIARLQQGKLEPVEELVKLVKERSREEELMAVLPIVGEVGLFLRTPARFSSLLQNALEETVGRNLPPAEKKPAQLPPEVVDSLADGLALIDSGKFPEARRFFEKYLASHPEHPEALYSLGLVDFKAGRYEQAITHLDKAAGFSPEHLAARVLLGQIYFIKKDWERLISHYEQLRERFSLGDDRVHSQVLGALGVAYFNVRKFKPAIALLTEGLKLNSRDLSSHYHLALAYYAVKDTGKALQLLKNLRKSLPPDSRVLRNVEELLLKLEEDAG
jgi:HEAT repeat protein/Tfp pilus assembly protein PilF